MEEKGTVKISLSGFFLILSLIAIIIMGFFIYKFYTDKKVAENKLETLSNDVTRLESTVNSLKSDATNNSSTINNSIENTISYNNASKTDTSLIEFTEREIKHTIQDYLDLMSALSGSTEGFIVKLMGWDYDESLTEKMKNIKYSEYKNKMLEYVTEKWFEEKFEKPNFLNNNGYLKFEMYGATGVAYRVGKITKEENSTNQNYTVEVYADSFDERSHEPINTEIHISSSNNKCVIDYCNLYVNFINH